MERNKHILLTKYTSVEVNTAQSPPKFQTYKTHIGVISLNRQKTPVPQH